MATNASSRAAVLLFAVYASLASATTTYTVGGVHSWMTGVDYADWASGKTFAVGDKLLFSYVRTDHTVTKVSRSEYDACSGSDATSEDNSSGLTTVTLATPGMHYFICTTPDHCAGGMKLAVNVSATTTASSGSGGGLEVTAGANAGGGLLVPVPVMASVAAAAATGALRSSNRAWAAVTDRAQPPAAYADGDSASACQGTDTVHLFMSRTPILV